ncbi:MAG: trigger factor [Kiritimatiellia bacterium]
MHTKVEESGDCRRMVQVGLGADEIREDYDKVVSMFMTSARIPGFRPGKAPRERVEARFRKQIEKETQDVVLPRAYREMIEKEQLDPVAVVDVQNVVLHVQNGMQFSVVLDVKPSFKLPKYKKITIASQSVDVADKDVDEAIEGVLQRMARYTDVETGVIADQDLVQVDYQAQSVNGEALVLDGEGVGELLEGKEYWLPVSGDNELIPGLLDALRGQEIGASVNFRATFPADYRIAALAGREIAYGVQVTALRKLQVPALDEEVLKRIGMGSEEDLRTRVRADLEAARKEQEDIRQREQVNAFLLENTKIAVPESQVAQERNTLLRSLLTRMAQQGATREMMEQHRDDVMANVARQADERVKLQYILSQVAEEESLKVESEDIENAFHKLAERYSMPVERLRVEVEKQDNGMVQFETDVLRDKVMDFLIGQAKIK